MGRRPRGIAKAGILSPWWLSSIASTASSIAGAAISSAKVAPKVGRGKSGVRGVSKELLQNTESVKIREAAVNQTVKQK